MQVSVKIVTLDGIFMEQEVPMVVLPAIDGEVGIMASHVPYVFKLSSGLVKLYDTDTHCKDKIFIFGGFAEVYENKIEVLTDKAVTLEELDTKFAQEKIILLEDQLLSSGEEQFLISVQKKLNLYRKILETCDT